MRARQRLIDAAKEVFEEHGFSEARVADIAKRAGQSHGTYYHYFDSKEAVFREVAARIDEQLFAPMKDVILAPSRLPPQLRVREAMRRHFKSYRREARILGLIEHVASFDAEVHAMRRARHQRYAEQVAGSIRQLQRHKLADPELDPVVTAAALGALTDRFAEIWLVQGAIDCTLEHAIEQVAQLLENALGLRASSQ
jgi:AcrR family transcriptional regulator